MKTVARIIYLLLWLGAGLLLYFFYDKYSIEQYVSVNIPLKSITTNSGSRAANNPEDVCRMMQWVFSPLSISFTSGLSVNTKAFTLSSGFSINIPSTYTLTTGWDATQFAFTDTRSTPSADINFSFALKDMSTTGIVEVIKNNDLTYCIIPLADTGNNYYSIMFNENTSQFGYITQHIILTTQSGSALINIPLERITNKASADLLTSVLNSITTK